MNQALGALLKGNNTTISIAHRLSTIKRSDSVIVLSSDGRVAQQGSYTELSQDPNGAFTQLMEWQMSGGEKEAEVKADAPSSTEAKPALTGYEDVVDGLSEDASEEEEEEDADALKGKGTDEAGPTTVSDKAAEK